MEKKKKRGLPLWAKLLIIVLALIAAFLAFSLITIRFFVGDSLTLQGTLAMVGYGGFQLPEWYKNLVLNVDRSYPGLPQLPTDPARRGDMLADYEKYMYGRTPTEGFDTGFEVISSEEVFSGRGEKRTVRITVSNDRGSFSANMLLVLPKGAKNRPVFIGETFSELDKAFEGSEWPFEMLIDRGYAAAALYYGDWAPDDPETYRTGVLRLFEDDTLSAYSAWAFGISRGIDYLESRQEINSARIASAGHSRLARVSLWAGACDGRIALATGSCGGGLLRSPVMGRITSDGTDKHWYTPEHLAFEGRDKELPVDMHTLYALMAGRHLFISMGENDLASDPVSMYDALQRAKAVFSEGYGQGVIPDGDYYDLPYDTPFTSEGMGFVIHSGGHKLTEEDWENYIAYMEAVVPDRIDLVSEHQGETVQLNDPVVTAYLNMSLDESLDYLHENYYKATFEPHDGQVFRFLWKGGEGPYTVEYSAREDFSGAETALAERNRFLPGTLLPGTRYWWRVTDSKGLASAVGTFVTAPGPRLILARERLDASGVRNVRDLGGYETDSGRVIRYGMLYRGGMLLYPAAADSYKSSTLNDYGRTVLERLGIRTEIDLRDENDDGGQTQAAMPGWDYLKVTYRGYTSIFPQSAWPDTVYSDSRSQSAFNQIFTLLSREQSYPVYFHCLVGQDRTGTLAYLILGLLGADYDDITRDYELTQFSAAGSGMDRQKSWTFSGSGVPAGVHTQDRVWETMHRVMMDAYDTGSGRLSDAVANYLMTDCGISQRQIDSIRRLLLTEG